MVRETPFPKWRKACRAEANDSLFTIHFSLLIYESEIQETTTPRSSLSPTAAMVEQPAEVPTPAAIPAEAPIPAVTTAAVTATTPVRTTNETD